MIRYKEYQANRKSNPAFLLNHIGRSAFEQAKSGEGNLIYNLITAQLMCSFTLEAAVNSLGQKLIKNWLTIERGLSVKQKIILISEISGFEIDFGLDPFQSLTEIVRFRNSIVHAKPSNHFSNEIPNHHIDANGFPKVPNVLALKTNWEKNCDIETASRWINAVNSMCLILSNKSGCQNPLIFGDMVDVWARIDTK